MEVKVYSTPMCPWCKRVKEYLKGRKVEFNEINVAGNKEATQEMIKKSGQMGVPVVDVDGKIIVGFDEEALEAALSGK
ncbi:MAG: glutaredoxin domain-containing protein [Candidatus Altiarchaeota archaeon]